jgi:cytochrome c oxidase cbb3-type subunit I/II
MSATTLPQDSAHPRSSQKLDSFSYDDDIVRMFMLATMVWGLVGTIAGVLVAVLLVMPQLSVLEYISFGRLRPLHTNAAIFAFAGNAIFAAIYHSTQRLCKARMWSDLLSRLHFWGWQLIIVAAAVTLPLGISQSKEYAELEWPIDIGIAVVWLLIFGTNFLMTLIHRRERHMYVALWFYIATIITVAILHVFNNLVIPSGALKSYSIYAGAQDAMMQWWYGHNAVAFFLTTPFLGLMYYYLPKAAGRPVFSYKLSIIHFWSLVFIYIWAGPHHLHYTSIATWASTMGMIFSLMLWMPSWGGMINGLLTLRGVWYKVASDPVLKFFVVGITFYGMATFEGPMLSIKSVNALSHYTDWTIAHVHSGALGWNGFMTFGMLYWMLPRMFQTKLYSNTLATWHFWLGTLGILLYIIPIYVAGLTQGLMWRALTEEGALQYPDFVRTVQAIVPLWWARVFGGLLYVLGMVLMAYNYFMTWRSRPARYDVPVIQAAPLARDYYEPEVKVESRLKGMPVLETANKLDVFEQMGWHRNWERMPIRFTAWVTIAVLVASGFSLIPSFLIRSNIPQTNKIKPYTPLELLGRDIYVAEGCYNCHSQQIRPLFAETLRYGEYSRAEEGIHDRPFQWGSRRIGPDLARQGGKNSHTWHFLHFLAPTSTTPNSIMPGYPHLLKELKYSDLPAKVAAVGALGDYYNPFSKDPNIDPIEDARWQARKIVDEMIELNLAQYGNIQLDQQGRPVRNQEGSPMRDDPAIPYAWILDENEQTGFYGGRPTDFSRTQIIALIAYMQRLGVDLLAEETAVTPVESDPTPDEASQSTNDSPATSDAEQREEEQIQEQQSEEALVGEGSES